MMVGNKNKTFRKIIKPKPVSELVLERLRADIVENKFALGEKISEANLALLYGVTKAPIRAAYIRLEAEGLLTIRAQSGTYVFQPTLAELRALCELRTALEVEAVQLALSRAPDQMGVFVTDICEQMQHCLDQGRLDRYQQLDTKLHDGIFTHAQSPLLKDTYVGRVSGPFAALRTRFGEEACTTRIPWPNTCRYGTPFAPVIRNRRLR